jgi:hypothetical protein
MQLKKVMDNAEIFCKLCEMWGWHFVAFRMQKHSTYYFCTNLFGAELTGVLETDGYVIYIFTLLLHEEILK